MQMAREVLLHAEEQFLCGFFARNGCLPPEAAGRASAPSLGGHAGWLRRAREITLGTIVLQRTFRIGCTSRHRAGSRVRIAPSTRNQLHRAAKAPSIRKPPELEPNSS